jgi:PAS domain S-box-containing protein
VPIGAVHIGNAVDVLDALVYLSNECVFAVDLDGRVIRWNRACEATFGYSATEVMGAVLPHIEASERVRTIARHRTAAAEGVIAEREGYVVRVDETHVAVREVLLPFKDEEGLAAGVFVMVYPLATDARLGAARDQLTALLGQHLREPLSAVVSAAQLLARPEVGDNRERRYALARTIVSKAKTAARLATDIGLAADLTAGTASLNTETIDLGIVAHEAAATVEDLADRFVVEFGPSTQPIVADRSRVRRAVGIMLEAALAASPAHGQIALSITQDESAAVIEVSDQGPPIARGDIAAVFDRFYGGREPRGRVVGGLGLSLVRGIAQAHGGTAVARVRSDGTTILSMTLPTHGSKRAE